MRVLLIHNPKAGDRKHGKKQLMASLARCGHQAFYQSIKERGWKKAFKKPVDLVIAAGGDGTVHKTAWQLMGSGIPLAILRLGTANNLARTLGFTESVDEILQSLHCGKAQPFDVGVARRSSRSEYFLEAAGGGLFADYFPAAEANEKERCFSGGRTDRALIAAAGVVVRLSGAQVENQHRRKGYFRSLHFWGVMNIRSAGPALHLAPKATTHDGRLDFVAVREDEREIFIKHVDAHLAERKARVPLTPHKFRELVITSPPGALHLDGEQWPNKYTNSKRQRSAVKITVKPGVLLIWHISS